MNNGGGRRKSADLSPKPFRLTRLGIVPFAHNEPETRTRTAPEC